TGSPCRYDARKYNCLRFGQYKGIRELQVPKGASSSHGPNGETFLRLPSLSIVQPKHVQGGSMSGERIMVVCEEPALRESITELIEQQGLESYPAGDGIDALRQIYHVRPQVIISDAALSRLSGFEFL